MTENQLDTEGKRLKYLRKITDFSQVDFANLIGFPRQNLSKAENDSERQSLTKEAIRNIILHFGVNYDWLIEGIGPIFKQNSKYYSLISDSVKTPDLTGENPEFWINSFGNKFTKVDGEIFIEVPILLHEAYARYIDETLEARIYESEKSAAFVVDKFDNARHLAFKVYGDSMAGGKMYDTPDKALVLGREVIKDTWLDGGLKNSVYGFIILTSHNILFKDITAIDKSKGNILCHSRNSSPEYSDFELNLNEVSQIFKIIKRTF